MEVTRQAVIHADPATVWAFAVDVERWPAVMSHIDRISRHDDSPLRIGSAATLELHGLPEAVWTVDSFTPATRFRWSARLLGMQWSADHLVEPHNAETTLLTLSVSASHWQARLLQPLLRWQANRALEHEFAGFRTACETASPPG